MPDMNAPLKLGINNWNQYSDWPSFLAAQQRADRLGFDAISIGGEAIFRKGIGPLLPGTEHVPPPHPSRCPFGCDRSCSLGHRMQHDRAPRGNAARSAQQRVSRFR